MGKRQEKETDTEDGHGFEHLAMVSTYVQLSSKE